MSAFQNGPVLFEIPARVKTDPILNNYLTQTMENNARSGVRRL